MKFFRRQVAAAGISGMYRWPGRAGIGHRFLQNVDSARFANSCLA
jgi:hypothetical protein